MGLTPEKDRPGFEPHDVRLTFENKYGVCRDKAALLVSLLEAAGFRSYPVLVNVGTKRDPEVPSPDFNHAIVSVEDVSESLHAGHGPVSGESRHRGQRDARFLARTLRHRQRPGRA